MLRTSITTFTPQFSSSTTITPRFSHTDETTLVVQAPSPAPMAEIHQGPSVLSALGSALFRFFGGNPDSTNLRPDDIERINNQAALQEARPNSGMIAVNPGPKVIF